ncbi:3-oxoacyl-ACP synthase III family protein [Nocardia sp. alder85J]|uniref:3-oxoacyl-ACP synthase III family protein n=1 Tax=Nocardia sp. alder85J TaxID=2862949 RepID=UPI001CD7C020|nr:3-oxoacyl-[acyl-carrier-protein] synthase III C-terminal domain-containing protein [Nocardia sp. alder85J]MCX4098759.1 3-oxoacyl-ACP synthase [Nocardia sp. alder85J]
MSVTVSLADVSSYRPGEPISADYFTRFHETTDSASSVMFNPPRFRHHVAAGESPADMAERALAPMLERHGANLLDEVDVLIVHTQLPETWIVGNGGEVAARFGITPEWLIDLHNGGCASFVHAMKLARQILSSTEAKSALIVNISNAAGQLFDQDQVRPMAQAAIPGDGAGIAWLRKSDHSPILDIETRHLPEYAGDMTLVADPPRRHWQAGLGQMHIGFTESGIVKVLSRGNEIVPEVARTVCDRIAVHSGELDLLITNQPNRRFLQNWRESLGVPVERHPDTFEECGNLFGAAMPLTFDHAVTAGLVPDGALVMFAGFAHAGDFAAAAAVRWDGRFSSRDTAAC